MSTRSDKSADPLVASAGAFLLAVGLCLIGLKFFALTSLKDLLIPVLLVYPLMLAIAGLSILLLEVGQKNVHRIFGRLLLVLALMIGVVDLIPKVLGEDAHFFNSISDIPSDVFLSYPVEWIIIAGLLGLLGSFDNRVCKSIGLGLAYFSASVLAICLLQIGWSSQRLVTEHAVEFGSILLIGLSTCALLLVPIRGGISLMEKPHHLLFSIPYLILFDALVMCVARLLWANASDSIIMSLGVLTISIVTIAVGARHLRLQDKKSIREQKDHSKAMSEYDLVFGNTKTGSWAVLPGVSEFVLSERAQQIAGESTHHASADLKRAIHDAFESGGSFSVITKNERGAYLEFSGGSVYDSNGTIIKLVGLMRDVTEQVEKFQQVQESKNLLEIVASTELDLEYIYDVHSRKYVYMSEPKSELLANVANILRESGSLEGYLSDDQSILHFHYSQVESAKDDSVFINECRIKNEIDENLYLEIRSRAIEWDEDYRATKVRGTIQIITDRVLREDKLRNRYGVMTDFTVQNSQKFKEQETPQPERTSVKQPKTVIVVTNDVGLQANLCNHIKNNGIRMKFASSIGHGLEMTFSTKPDVLVFVKPVPLEDLGRIVRAIAAEPSLQGTKIAVAQSSAGIRNGRQVVELDMSGDFSTAIDALAYQD